MLALYTRLYLALYPNKLAKDDAGVTAIEYGLIAALIAVVCIAVWTQIGTGLESTFQSVANSL